MVQHHPKLLAMKLKLVRQSLGIADDKTYTSQEALVRATEAEASANLTPTTHPNREFFIDKGQLWLRFAALLEEAERRPDLV